MRTSTLHPARFTEFATRDSAREPKRVERDRMGELELEVEFEGMSGVS